MRTIKFRGYAHHQNRWVYGSLLLDGGEAWITETEQGLFVDMNHQIKLEPIEPKTIGQFIGLTDKNGKEIYEGDIIKNKFRERYQTLVCYWNEINNGFSFRDQFDGYNRSLTSCEVIGNIHENNELLKGDKNETCI